MKLSTADLLPLRLSLLLLVSSVLLGGVALYGSIVFSKKAKQELLGAQKMDIDARQSLAAAHEEQNNIAAYAAEYRALINNKLIGDERRLDWIEGLEKLHRQNVVTDFSYSIAPQTMYSAKPPMASGNFDIHYSEMRLQLDLLHETQLINFFSALRSQMAGRYQLESCTLQRVGVEHADAAHATAASTNLKAECVGGWITLKNRNSKT